MIHTAYHPRSLDNINLALSTYTWLLGLNLSDESIEARYHLLSYLGETHNYHGTIDKSPDNVPEPLRIEDQTLYWSISHTECFIAYSVSDNQTGIDIAEYDERDTALFDVHDPLEYHILGSQDWWSFYILWTAKEAIIKVSGSTLDAMGSIQIQKKLPGGICVFEFGDKTYTIQTKIIDTLILSYTIS